MREIKFRAWNKETDKMIFLEDVDCHFELSDTGLNVLDLTQEPDDFGFSHFDVELMQYTGLKDKNGIEIYEGDIVLVSDGIDSYVTDVYWGGKEYPAFDLNYKYIPSLSYYESNVLSEITNSGLEEIEVIGNIYENKEILEEK